MPHLGVLASVSLHSNHGANASVKAEQEVRPWRLPLLEEGGRVGLREAHVVDVLQPRDAHVCRDLCSDVWLESVFF